MRIGLLRRKTSLVDHGQVRLWIKILYSLFLCVLVPIYWHHYGPSHFLWGSDIALFLVFVALCSEKPLPNSMMAIGVLPFEIVWSIDFLAGAQLLDIAGYMYESKRPLYLRSLSLFHIALPLIMIFLLRRLGYDRRALAVQTLLTWIVLPVTYLVTDPAANINWVFGFGRELQTVIHPLLYLALGMILLPVVVYLPGHLVLQRLFSHRRNKAAKSHDCVPPK